MDRNVDIEKLKSIELDLLNQFIEICEKYDLKWFVLGGTCLGAVRHKGFIPWDDDIDVGMPRDQYEKFLYVAPNELSPEYFVQSIKSEPEFPANFAKLRNSNTTFVEVSLSKFRINHGVYIDIFPLDGYKNSRYFDFCNALYSKRIGYSFANKREKENIAQKIKKILIYIVLPSLKRTVKKREKLFLHFNYYDSNLIANYCGAWGRKEIVNRNCFGDGIKGTFEGVEVNLPVDYDKYLSSLYGDYMTLPPEEKRVAHHYTKVIDLENSYIKYLNNY